MKALLLAASAPDATTASQTGTTNWILRLTQVLHRLHEVTLITTPPVNEPWFKEVGLPVIEHEPAPIQNGAIRIAKSLINGIYPSIWLLHSPKTSAYLRNLQPGKFDVCWILEDYGGIYLRDVPRHLPVAFHRSYIFSMQDSFCKPGGNLKNKLRGWYRKRTASHFDRWTTARANLVSTGTSESCKFIERNYRHNHVECMPVKPCHKPEPTTPDNLDSPKGPDGRLLAVYLADMRFIRNAVGARWFLEEVLPTMSEDLRKRYHFKFIGRKPDPCPAVNNLPKGSSVGFAGFVDNLTSALHMAQVAFIPVFGGNGVRLKTLTLLGTGLPTVSTPDALEGLDASHGRTVLKATSPNEFTNAFEQLLDSDLRKQLSQNSLQCTEKFLEEKGDAEQALAISKMITNKI